MARIAGINLPTGKRVAISLTYIHGVGTNTARKICTELKIPMLTKLNELDDIQLSSIRDYIDSHLMVEGDLRREKSMNAIVGFSGRIIREDTLNNELKSKPPIYLIHGDQDQMVPYKDTINAAKILEKHNVEVQTHISKNTQHSIAEDGLEIAIKFLASNYLK